MKTIETLRQALPEFARDVRLNLGSLMSPGATPELTREQTWGTALAAAIASRSKILTAAIESAAAAEMEPATIEAARTAAAVMAMTNVYYRAIHMAGDDSLSRLPAGLRMNGLVKHRIAQADFELFGLAASAVNGCENCIKAHVAGAREHGVGVPTVQTVIRVAAVIHATATVLDALPSDTGPTQPAPSSTPPDNNSKDSIQAC
jgi:lipoyl-dependent peroxiredoxin subunit D